jgi:hypothetical protein
MGVLQMVRDKMTGDDLDDLTRRIDDTRSSGIRGHAELEKLEAARLAAASYDEARAIDEQIAACRWGVDHAASQLQELEQRLSVARAARNRKLLLKHQDIARKILPRLVAAVSNAADVQEEAMAARNAAIADLGEAAVSVHIEASAYLGMLTRPFVDAWADAMAKRLAAPAPQPAPVAMVSPRVAEKPARPVGVADKRIQPVQPVAPAEPAKSRRPLRAAKVAVGDRRLVKFHRANVELEDGDLSLIGDVVDVPAATAEALVRNAAADYLS